MEAATLSAFRVEFAKRAEWKREDEKRALDQIKLKEDKDQKRERKMDADQDAFMDAVLSVLATETEIADFNVKLDTYDAATVDALMENEETLKAVRAEMRIMLDKAYVLHDGRKVFKTEDGSRVFDEKGQEVKDFDPKLVEDWRPRWEKFQDPFEKEAVLVEERGQLVEYQGLLDKTREEANEDGLTKAELDDLEKRLQENMPDAVKRRLANEEPDLAAKAENGNKAETAFKPAGKLDMPAL